MDAVHFSEALNQEVTELTHRFNMYQQGGFQIREVLRFVFACTDAMAELGTQYLDLSHADQKQEVIEAIRLIYMSRNPDLPWITEPFETMLEQAIFTYIIPELFSVMVASKLRNQQGMKSKRESHAMMMDLSETPQMTTEEDENDAGKSQGPGTGDAQESVPEYYA
jgi:hypothetical protein